MTDRLTWYRVDNATCPMYRSDAGHRVYWLEDPRFAHGWYWERPSREASAGGCSVTMPDGPLHGPHARLRHARVAAEGDYFEGSQKDRCDNTSQARVERHSAKKPDAARRQTARLPFD